MVLIDTQETRKQIDAHSVTRCISQELKQDHPEQKDAETDVLTTKEPWRCGTEQLDLFYVTRLVGVLISSLVWTRNIS